MKRTFRYQYNGYTKDGNPITLEKTVTDKMEERDWMKPGFAAGWFNKILREKYGFKKSIVTAASVEEV